VQVQFPPPPVGSFGSYLGNVIDTIRRSFLRVVS
jgi:hypothetical protein